MAAPASLVAHITGVNAREQSLRSADGATLVFAGLLYPDASLAEAWMAKHLLQTDFAYSTSGDDRYGRKLITSTASGAMLRDGVAVLIGSHDAPEDGWAQEAMARGLKRGVWADADMILAPDTAANHLQQFHLVEGRITHIYSAKNATYLNFGDDWHTDFSVMIPAKLRRSMKELLTQLREGSRVRVRGVIYPENGPMIRLSHKTQLEML